MLQYLIFLFSYFLNVFIYIKVFVKRSISLVHVQVFVWRFLAKQKWHLSIGGFKLIRVTWLHSNSPRLKYVCYPKKQNLKKQKQNQHLSKWHCVFPPAIEEIPRFVFIILMLHLSPKPTVINTWYAFFFKWEWAFCIWMFYYYARCI